MRRAHSAVVRAPMARREGILVFVVVECNDVGIAFKLLMGVVSQRPALIKVVFRQGKSWRCKVKTSVLVGGKVHRGRKTSCCGEEGLLSKQEVAVVAALARA